MDSVEEFLHSLSLKIITNIAYDILKYTALVILIPILILVISTLTSYELGFPFFVMLTVWVSTIIASVAMFASHRKMRTNLTLEVARVLSPRERHKNGVLVTDRSLLNDPAAVQLHIEVLLRDMCSILNYRLRRDKKGASFLLANDGGFRLLAQHNHDDRRGLPQDIRSLGLDDSFAGLALKSDTCLVLPNSTKGTPPPGIRWKCFLDNNNRRKSTFVGRAAVAVQGIDPQNPDDPINIGVICYDTKTKIRLNDMEKQLMFYIADKAVTLFLQRTNRGS